jgi:superfamily II DNA/RNA helicase
MVSPRLNPRCVIRNGDTVILRVGPACLEQDMARTQPPQQGQMVFVRNRRFVVADVLPSALVRHASDTKSGPQHLVTLIDSIEDDASGEELQLIWELEVGARAEQKNALPVPTRFDSPDQLQTFLNAVRWGAVSNADIQSLQAPFRSGITIEDYQLDPVVRALDMPRVNLLIADDVGLGKTIEAGLVLQELLLRQRARKILIVCPAALQIQWRDQMRDKFGLDFRIVDSDLMRELRRQRGLHANPWSHFPRLITSIDYIKRDRPLRLFQETVPSGSESAYPRAYDVLVVDEAHNVAPPHHKNYAVDSQRTTTIRTLAPHFEHKLFLSATPHNGYLESFSALLELLDDQRFARDLMPDATMLQSVMVRRLKSDFKDSLNRNRFPERKLEMLEVEYSEAERQAHQILQQYTQSRSKHAQDSSERTAIEFVLKLLKKRLFSSPRAFSNTLNKHIETLTNGKRAKVERKPSVGLLRSLIQDLDELSPTEAIAEQEIEDALETTGILFDDLHPQEQQWLEQLRTWADTARNRSDSKAEKLFEWLRKELKPDGQWNNERVIIFTEYRDTQKWLHELLSSRGLGDVERLELLAGDLNDEDRERIKALFQAPPNESKVRILLATDAASEGIDLQRYCHRLVHFEIPWNPNRLEQRNGRIDRHGQQHNPQIFHFAPKGYDHDLSDADSVAVGQLEGDLEFLVRAVRKVDQIRQDLGKVGPVIAEQIGEAMSGERRRLDTAVAERDDEPSKKLLKFEQKLDERIKKLHTQLQESRQNLHIQPENIQAAVQLGLQLAGQAPLKPVTVKRQLADGRVEQIAAFEVPSLNRGWERCTEGLAHVLTHKLRPIVFDHELVRGYDDVVLVHLNHPLVQTSLRLLRAEIWSSEERRKLSRVASQVFRDGLVVDGKSLNKPIVLAYGRLVLVGGDSQRLHEELITVGVSFDLNTGAIEELSSDQVQAVLQAATAQEPHEQSKQVISDHWQQANNQPEIAKALERALRKQRSSRLASLKRKLEARQNKEQKDIAKILNDLRTQIDQELREHDKPRQLKFDFVEAEQYTRNITALRQRRDKIAQEIIDEQRNIAQRYADPQDRLFPLALLFLLPRSMA